MAVTLLATQTGWCRRLATVNTRQWHVM